MEKHGARACDVARNHEVVGVQQENRPRQDVYRSLVSCPALPCYPQLQPAAPSTWSPSPTLSHATSGPMARTGYLPQPALDNLKKYSYKGVDKCVHVPFPRPSYAHHSASSHRSLVSRFVLQPFWTWLVTLWPTWVAPNTVRPCAPASRLQLN